jgi:5-methyltetrahydropteroyltriglutamate--homocysteine methyltransferase
LAGDGTPPFRADQVGSLLRPPELRDARVRHRRGELSAEALREVEDRCIREAVAKQEAIGLRAVTDGEFRRDYWHNDFLARLDGVTLGAMAGPKFQEQDENPPVAATTGRIACSQPIMVDHFAFLKAAARATAKFTIPSPSMLHLRPGRAGTSRAAYPEMEAFWADVAAAWQRAIAHLADAGCTYLQLDDVSFSYLCDPQIQAACRRNGDDPSSLPRTYADAINTALSQRPAGLTVTMHTCRGNFRSAWVASGGYDPVAEAMFSAEVDGFFMEFDDERSGGFEPLRLLPRGKKVVLGLVSTKTGKLESRDALRRRIDEAARFVPLEYLCLSPQCGFSSTHHGNALSCDEQWRKLERVVEVAREIWSH